MTFRHIKNFANDFLDAFIKHDLLTLAAALAFYTALSLAPLLLITVAVFGILGADLRVQLVSQVHALIGNQAGEMVKVVIEGAQERPDLSKLGGILGFLTLIFSASGVFAQLQSSLNLIWQTEASPKSGIAAWLRHRLLSMGMVLSLGFISLVSLAINAVLSFLVTRNGNDLWILLDQGISLFIYTLLFALIFKVLPDAKTSWRKAISAGVLTAVLFMLGKWLIGLYLGQSAVASAYGAAGSLIIFLLWVYYSSLVLFIGGELAALRGRDEIGAPAKAGGRAS